jgi:fluoride exporter
VTAWIAMALVGSLGALARYGLGTRWGAEGILLANLSGAFALGVLHGAGVGGDALLIFGTGFLGAFTTFSTWMVERRYIAFSIVAGFALAWLGSALG